MSDIFEPITEGLLTPEQNLITDTSVLDAMRDAANTAELTEEDASWLETLVDRILAPITEVITPAAHDVTEGESTSSHEIQEAIEVWHIQDSNTSCAVCAQQFIINEFMDLNVSEEELCVIAQAQGWYDAESGTSPEHVGNLLSVFGIDTHIEYNGTFDSIKSTLDQGGRVIVGVDSLALWTEGYNNVPLYGADHAIEVIGIDDSDPSNVSVIINDSGTVDGCGKAIPYQEFMEAWGPSGGFMVSAFPGEA